ncbi:hypothetical protein C8R46DRAFT_1357567 [Mycena filopes]|nr:hypothetical protein C8R46DRAFT_1357567 [Mycena filopes]
MDPPRKLMVDSGSGYFELLLCVLALPKGYHHVRSLRGRNLYEILIRDSVMYYVLIQFFYAYNLILWLKSPKSTLDAPARLAADAVGVSLAMGEIPLGEISFTRPSTNETPILQ